jgi:drug/metabolite transporter (DMT)-like permease
MFVLALGLASAISWGAADFVGGLANRARSVVIVALTSQLAGLVLCLVVLAASGHGPPRGAVLGYGALAGVSNAVGLTAFYRALALGRMSVVAPVVGTSALLPVLVAVATGERPSGPQTAGIAIAIAGIVLASREVDRGGPSTAMRWVIPLAVLAAIGVGANLLWLQKAVAASPSGSVFWPIAAARGAAVAVLLCGARAALGRRGTGGRRLGLVVLGVLDLTANVLYALATRETLASVAAVLASLHPVITVLLARALLGERLRRLQQAGVALALLGTCLLAGG